MAAVGAIQLDAVPDAVGLLAAYGDAFPDVPAEAWAPYRELYPELVSGDQWRLPCRSFLVRSGETTVLVDTSVGPPGLWDWTAEREGELPEALAALQVAPDDVDLVFLTHMHIDHVGWNADLEGVALFPRARYVVHRDSLEFARTQDTRPHVRRCILPLADRFEQVSGDVELAAGVTAFEAPGHYPGHMAVRIESEGEQALLIADIAVHPALLDEPEWVYVSDGVPDTCAATRLAVVPALVDADVLVACGHYPGSGIGRIVTRDGMVVWEEARLTWPRDDAKLERVRTLMDERGLDALVVRAPDNVLYLTNFWGMKGYDACVFPREGEPALICLEASEEDAARTAWTSDVRLFKGYDELDPRPPTARVLEVALEVAGEYGKVGLELSLGTQAADRMVGEPTTFTAEWFTAFGEVEDATPLLAEARALKTEQEIERMRLANDIAAAAMEHCRLIIEPGMTEAQIAAEWEGFVHGEGTGWEGKVSTSRSGSRSSGRGRGSRRSRRRRHGPWSRGSRRCSRSGSARTATGATTRRTSSSASSRRSTARSRRVSWRCTTTPSPSRTRVRASPSSTGASGPGSTPWGFRASRRTRSATASAPARTSRRTLTRPAGARSPLGWCLQSSQDAISRVAVASGSRTTS